MGGIAEKSGTRRHRLQNARLAFLPQVHGDVTTACHETDKGFRLVGVELIDDEGPVCLRVCVKGLGDVSREVSFCTSGTDGRRNDLAGGDFQVSHQAQGTVPLVLKLAPFHLTRLHGFNGKLKGLDAGFLVGADQMSTLFM